MERGQTKEITMVMEVQNGVGRHETQPGRAKRRLNGMAERAGVPDPPTRGRLARDVALVEAALRVWQAKNCPGYGSVWRHRRR